MNDNSIYLLLSRPYFVFVQTAHQSVWSDLKQNSISKVFQKTMFWFAPSPPPPCASSSAPFSSALRLINLSSMNGNDLKKIKIEILTMIVLNYFSSVSLVNGDVFKRRRKAIRSVMASTYLISQKLNEPIASFFHK